ncbi:Peptidyl-prolyl cis-trans isomerase [Vigna angularis]|uniref:Peptidyl-prolyl cis-trans isomerase n=1 Tax=Phaseolus angularis TaxID=3914 RepID=A0A8T0JRV7_PHAAN|nr:Peptidyl-prolyl cis-trans isomerase [Vigna angularis]
MIQGGDPTGTGKGGTSIWGKKFNDEIRESLKDAAIEEICVQDGFVVLDLMEKLGLTQTGAGDRPLAEIRLNRVTIHANPLAG